MRARNCSPPDPSSTTSNANPGAGPCPGTGDVVQAQDRVGEHEIDDIVGLRQEAVQENEQDRAAEEVDGTVHVEDVKLPWCEACDLDLEVAGSLRDVAEDVERARREAGSDGSTIVVDVSGHRSIAPQDSCLTQPIADSRRRIAPHRRGLGHRPDCYQPAVGNPERSAVAWSAPWLGSILVVRAIAMSPVI